MKRIEKESAAPPGLQLVGETRITNAPPPHCGRGFAADSYRRTKDGTQVVVMVFTDGCGECFEHFLEWPFVHQAQVLGIQALAYATVQTTVNATTRSATFVITPKPTPGP